MFVVRSPRAAMWKVRGPSAMRWRPSAKQCLFEVAGKGRTRSTRRFRPFTSFDRVLQQRHVKLPKGVKGELLAAGARGCCAIGGGAEGAVAD